MNAETVAAWLTAGEGEHTEFKEKYSSRVIESLVAFADTAGGRVLVGVNDRGRIVGLPDADKVIESVLSACGEAGSPPMTPVVAIVCPAVPGRRQATGGRAGRSAGRGYRTDACQERRSAGPVWPADAAGVRRGNPHLDVA
jgi:hypothetical protein